MTHNPQPNSTTPTDDEPLGEILQTHIYRPEQDFTVHTSVMATPDDTDFIDSSEERVEIVLSEGGDFLPSDVRPPTEEYPIIIMNASNADIQRAFIHHTPTAIGYNLHGIELHDFNEKVILNGFKQVGNDEQLAYEKYENYISGMSKEKRQLRLLDLLEYRSHQRNDWTAEPYLDECVWRSTNLGESGKDIAEEIHRNIEIHPKFCYRNAQKAAIKHADNHLIDYVEGVALPKHCGQAIRHAWIEYDGNVIELTWPWHRYDGDGAVYFGTEYDPETVKETFERRNGGSPLILSDDKIEELNQIV